MPAVPRTADRAVETQDHVGRRANRFSELTAYRCNLGASAPAGAPLRTLPSALGRDLSPGLSAPHADGQAQGVGGFEIRPRGMRSCLASNSKMSSSPR